MPHTNGDPTQRPKLFSDDFIGRIGEDLANQIIDQICRGLTEPQRPTSLCLEIIVFELDEDLLRKLVQCVFVQMNPVQLAEQIIRTVTQVNRILNGHNTASSPPASEPTPAVINNTLPICKFDLIHNILARVSRLEDRLLDTCHLRERIFEEILLQPTHLSPALLSDITAVTDHVVIQNVRQALITQHDNFALKNCNKVSCINSDLEFIADQIKQLTINFPAGELGIIELADAAGGVAEAFHSEEHDFAEIFDAVDAVAEIIEDLAEFYKVKLTQLERLLNNAISGCPVPIEARATLPAIPELAPPPAIFPIVGLNPLAQTSIIPTLPIIPTAQ